jgi:hypothetical protein
VPSCGLWISLECGLLLVLQEHLTCGYFPRAGDFVKVLLVDDFEAPYFLRGSCFKGGPEGLWTPVGVVVRSQPLRDQAEVQVHFLCHTDSINVRNIHLLPLSEEEYRVSCITHYKPPLLTLVPGSHLSPAVVRQSAEKRILESRQLGLSVLENILCRSEPRLLARMALPVADQRCQITFFDCYTSIRLSIYNAHLSRRYALVLDQPALQSLGLCGPSERLPDLSLQRKEVICKHIPEHLTVWAGQVVLNAPGRSDGQDSQGPLVRSEQLLWVAGKLEGVDVEVAFRALGERRIEVRVTHVVSELHTRLYVLAPVRLELWKRMGYPGLHWLREEDRQEMTRQLLKRLRHFQGVPALDVDGTLLLPLDFEPFNEAECES